MKEKILLEAKDLKKYFPVKAGLFRHPSQRTLRAVDNVSFTLYEGETLGVIGESGCGKSTLARLVMGLLSPTEGVLSWEGTEMSTNMPPRLRKEMQMVFQDPYSSLDPRMNIRRIIEEPLRVHTKLRNLEKEALILPLMEQVGLSAESLNRYPHEFSGGQRQRIGIARALVLNPRLLICDEPVSALDVSIQAQILNLFSALKKTRNLTYLFISHDMGVIKHVSDRIMVMYLGRVVEIADKYRLFANAAHPYTRALISAIPVPDPQLRGRENAILLKGELPSPIDIPDGCPFASRCLQVREQCKNKAPSLQKIGDGHFVACHFAKEALS